VKNDMSNPKKVILSLFLLKFEFSKDTAIAFFAGLAVILTSFGLYLFPGDSITDEVGFYVFRDIIMMFGIGFAFPLHYILITKKGSIKNLGITKNKLALSLFLNVVLAILLMFQFMVESRAYGKEIILGKDIIIPVIYIFTAGIFEVIFFYGFLRQQFEKAFGIIPGILLAALFYSLHHAGFQPEFFKLLFVGIMYASVYRITNNAFIIFPFFWGVGAIWDVLVNFGAQEHLQGTWTLFKAVSVLVLMALFSIYLIKKLKYEKIKIAKE